jgi:hypothetical protein
VNLDSAWFYLQGLGWLLLMLGPLLFFQRRLHREIQLALLLLTRHPTAALGIFSLLFFPGVLLHEFSHFMMAQLLMVKTGRFSVIPQVLPGGQLRLGYVETVPTDWLRDAMIGAAPLLSGGAAIAYLGGSRLGLAPLVLALEQNSWDSFWNGLAAVPQQADFWLWFYLAFAISSTMLPSSSDRRAWLPLALIFALLAVLALLVGAGPWMLENLAAPLNGIFRLVATIFGISLALHLVLLLPTMLFRRFLMGVTGLVVVEPP